MKLPRKWTCFVLSIVVYVSIMFFSIKFFEDHEVIAAIVASNILLMMITLIIFGTKENSYWEDPVTIPEMFNVKHSHPKYRIKQISKGNSVRYEIEEQLVWKGPWRIHGHYNALEEAIEDKLRFEEKETIVIIE